MLRELSSSDAHPGAGREFVTTFFVVVALLLAGVFAFNLYVDPLSVTRAHRYAERSPEPSFRAVKAALIRKLPAAPDVLFLGSSSSERIDPAVVSRVAHVNSFNAAVTNGTPVDSYTLASYLDERFPKSHPHLVYGIDVHRVLDPSVVLSPANLSVPALRRQLTTSEATKLRLHMLEPYATWETTRLSWDVMHSDKPDAAVPAARFTAAGALRADPYRNRERDSYIAGQVDYYRHALYASGDFRTKGEFSRYYVDQLIRRANEHGDEPAIFLSPVHPDFVKGIGRDWNEQRTIVRSWLDNLRDSGRRFRVYDLSNPATFGGDPNRFDDHVHMDDVNVTRMVAYLAKRGALVNHGN